MKDNFFTAYIVECVSAGIALVAFMAALALGAGGVVAASPAAGASLVLCALALGVLCGSLLRRMADGDPLAARDARIAELEVRPTPEAFTAACSARDAAAAGLASAQAELASLSEELSAAAREREELAQEVSRARTTASLSRFSDFQLLAMCDICDAEDTVGYLSRPYGDPAMEQLQALDAVAFDISHDQAGADASGELRWTLKPEWRQAVRAQRAYIDGRTRSLRERRGSLGE